MRFGAVLAVADFVVAIPASLFAISAMVGINLGIYDQPADRSILNKWAALCTATAVLLVLNGLSLSGRLNKARTILNLASCVTAFLIVASPFLSLQDRITWILLLPVALLFVSGMPLARSSQL